MKHLLIITFLFSLLLIGNKTQAENNGPISVEITGNWSDQEGFRPLLQVREPELTNEEVKVFTQELNLPEGNYSVSFEYNNINDRSSGRAIGNQYESFNGFEINGRKHVLKFTKASEGEGIYRAQTAFQIKGDQVTRLKLAVRSTRPLRTWLKGNSIPLDNNAFFAVKSDTEEKEYLLVRGIPFQVRKTNTLIYAPWFRVSDQPWSGDRGSLKPWSNGMHFNLEGIEAEKIHFLGMIHNVDIANGSWYRDHNDYGFAHYVGDQAGEIILSYTDEQIKDTIPLIFGFNLWYGRPWDMLWQDQTYHHSHTRNHDKELFSGRDYPRDLIRNNVSLVDGVRMMGSASHNTRYIFSLDIEGKSVKSIKINGTDDMHGYPLISGITVESASNPKMLSNLPAISTKTGNTLALDMKYIADQTYQNSNEKIQHLLYTSLDELPDLIIPEIPEGYFGPRYDFRGTREAIYTATYLYRNGPEVGAKIADSGTGCGSSIASKRIALYTLGIGVWWEYHYLFDNLQDWFRLYKTREPGNLPGRGSAWSRGIGALMREALGFGYGKYIHTYTHWLDSCLMNENPPHWIRVPYIGTPRNTRQVGDILETGNRENDGHGICMMGRYMTYHWLGHDKQWNQNHWEATKASVDWIQWQLDTDTIFPGEDKDILYTNSECGNYEFFGSYNCLHGIKLAIKMAEDLGKTEEVLSWTKLHDQLEQGILDNLVESSDFGPVWHTKPENNWNDDGQKMVHLNLASDGFTYTPLQDYARGDKQDARFLEIDRNSYRYLMNRNKDYNYLRMYGYGQGWMTQAALLLDEMEDAEQFINMMVTHCYLPRLEGWTAPEGIMLHKSGEMWLPVNGYTGQDSHLAGSMKALRLMLGIDDNDMDHLRLVPRYPASWNQMAIKDCPVLTGKQRQKISYTYQRDTNGQSFMYSFTEPVGSMSLRLGPIPEDKKVTHASLNGKDIDFENLRSGDSRWIWIHNLKRQEGTVEIFYD